jgi:hypothetical protein
VQQSQYAVAVEAEGRCVVVGVAALPLQSWEHAGAFGVVGAVEDRDVAGCLSPSVDAAASCRCSCRE